MVSIMLLDVIDGWSCLKGYDAAIAAVLRLLIIYTPKHEYREPRCKHLKLHLKKKIIINSPLS